jgi:hypothetical protein
MEAKKDAITLLPGERLVLSSKRGGNRSGGLLEGALIAYGSIHLLGCLGMIPMLLLGGELADDPRLVATAVFSALQILVVLVLGVLWLFERKKTAFFLTNKRFIVRRFLRAPLHFELDNIAIAQRRVVRIVRYTSTREYETHDVVLAFRTGGSRVIGPIEHVETLMDVLGGVVAGVVDPGALPGENGEPPDAEARRDLFFAPSMTARSALKGPLFVGPTKLIAFPYQLSGPRLYQMLTLARKETPASDVEAKLLELAQSKEWGRGRAVIAEREGLALPEGKGMLRVGAGKSAVALDLHPPDRTRLSKFLNDHGPHPYRG